METPPKMLLSLLKGEYSDGTVTIENYGPLTTVKINGEDVSNKIVRALIHYRPRSLPLVELVLRVTPTEEPKDVEDAPVERG